MDANVIVGVALPAVFGLVWLIRLEGRVNTHEAECSQRQQRMDERHTDIGKKLDGIDSKLDRLMSER